MNLQRVNYNCTGGNPSHVPRPGQSSFPNRRVLIFQRRRTSAQHRIGHDRVSKTSNCERKKNSTLLLVSRRSLTRATLMANDSSTFLFCSIGSY